MALSPKRRRVLSAAALAGTLLVLLVVFHHPLVGFALGRVLSLATGYDVRFGDHRLGREHGALFDVHVTKNGDPVLDAPRIDVTYQLRDIFPGGAHRFGFASLAMTGPVISIIRHRDGGYNFNSGNTGSGAPAPAQAAAAPYFFTVRIRDGAIRLIDQAPLATDLAEQEVSGVAIDASVKSNARTTASMSGVLIGRRVQNVGVERWPLGVKSVIDYDRGYTLHRFRARALPLRGMLGFLLHSSAFRIDDGVLDRVDIKVYAINIAVTKPFTYRVGGGGDLVGARIAVGSLLRPVRDVHGSLAIVDDGLWTKQLSGSLAGVTLRVRGGIYDLQTPTLRFGVSGDGDLANLRAIFGFSQKQPIVGRAHIETILESKVENPLVRTVFNAPRAAYGKIPLRGVDGMADYQDHAVVLSGVHAHYGASSLTLGGRFIIGEGPVDSAIAVAAQGPGRDIPYAENIAPEANIDVLALITGYNGYRARGAISATGDGDAGYGFFDVNERGVGEFGPFAFERGDGSSLVGALRLERPISQSAGWVSARNYRVDVPANAAGLPGLTLPGFPPVGGVIDGAFAGGGSPSAFTLAGSASGRDLQIAGYNVGRGSASIGGTLDDVRIGAIHVDGPLGRFSGSGVAHDGMFAVSGDYDGSLQALAPITHEYDASGGVSGPIAATIAKNNVVVQTSGARLTNARVRGIAIDAASGTIELRDNILHVIAADAGIGGSHAVASESDGTVAISAPDLPSRALRGTGIPLQAGVVSIFGRADLRGSQPSFDGTVAVSGGRADGYPVSGDARVLFAGQRAVVRDGTGALGATYGTFGGTVDGVGGRGLSYDLDAGIPLGDIGVLQRDLRLPLRYIDGSFTAQLRVRGSGAHPSISGPVTAPEGSYNGLAFRDAKAQVALDPFGVAARNGRLTVGTTQLAVDANVAGRAFAVAVQSNAADLADFNDYFDASETLAGKGPIDVAFRAGGRRVVTHGDVTLAGLRFRQLPLGDTRAQWLTNGSAIRGQATTANPAGSLATTFTVVPNGGDPVRAFTTGRYDGTASLTAVDLNTWLPAAGIVAPVLGIVDAHASFAGRFPNIGVGGDASLHNGSIGGLSIASASLHATSAGKRITIAQADADLGFVQLAASGSLGLGLTDPLALELRVNAPDVGVALHTIVPRTRVVDVGGVVEADVRVAGTLDKPKIDGGFDISAARYRNLHVPRVLGVIGLDGDALTLRDAEVIFTKGQAFVAGSLPLEINPFAIGPPGATLSFDVTARGVDLAQFATLFPTGTQLGGTIDGRFGVDGDVAHPQLLGSLALAGGSYMSTLERAPIQQVNAQFVFAGTSVALQAFHANVGGGTLDGSGNIRLPLPGGDQIAYTIDVRANGARLDFPAYGQGKVDGDLKLTSGADRPLLSGNVALSNATIPFASIFHASSASASAGGTGRTHPLDPAFAVHAVAGRNVRVRSSIIDIGATGAVDLEGTLSEPRLAGEFSSTGGTFSTYNHTFRVENAVVKFDPAAGVVPDINLRATTHVTNPDPDPTRNIAGSADITVSVQGPADSYTTTLTSNPPYSDAQIAGLLLDLPAILGAVNFNGGQGGTLLRGAPGESNVLLPPGVSPEQTGAISLNQEVFSLLNGQFTQRALAPIEQNFERVLGVSDLAFTIDYSGGIGYSLRRQLGAHDFYALLSQTLSYPERTNLGFELRPDPVTSVNFAYFRANGVTSLITTQTQSFSGLGFGRNTSFQPLGDREGFTFTITRRSW